MSPCVPNNVLNVLYSYVFTVKMFNCDYYNTPLAAVQVNERSIGTVLSVCIRWKRGWMH